MAPSKAGADNAVNERRLRPIYDWLDNGNNKKALQEAEKVLKKQPSLQCAKVLKALAMIRLGKSEEAQVVLNQVLSSEPCDDATLQAMTICFKETHRPELTCQAYEAAVKKDPTNEEFLSHLFMGYVRLGDYRKQQQTAMALFKAKPKNPYYFWAVMSLVMQTYGNKDEKVCLNVTLPLAERMIKKFIDENKIEAEAEVQLYLMVLEKEGKFKEALKVVEGPLADKLATSMVHEKRGDYLRQLQLWPQVVDYYESLLHQQPDQWIFYVHYFEAMFELMCNSNDLKASVDRAICLLDSLLEETNNGKERIRGPHLARLYLWQQLHRRQLDAVTLLGGKTGRCLMQSYVTLLGDKPCAFQDLKPFVSSLLTDDDSIDGFLTFCSSLPNGTPSTVKELCRHLLHAQLVHFLGRGDDIQVQLAAQLWTHYLNTKSLSNDGLLATDFRPNDNYALMAAHLLLDAWLQEENGPDLNSSLLAKCLSLLETALINSPANYHLKLLTMRVYTVAGHGQAALQRYETLDVKYIQLDSLGHLLCRPLISLGLPSCASSLLSSTLRFFTSHARETADSLIAAYRFGSFIKIPEFTQFTQRLDLSLHFAAATAERMLLDLLLAESPGKMLNTAVGMYADADKDQPDDWSGLVDNRDCSIFISWHTPQQHQMSDEMMKKETFEAEVQFARLRNRLVHAVIAALSLSPGWQQAAIEEGVPISSMTSTASATNNGHQTNGGGGGDSDSGQQPSSRNVVLERLVDEIGRLLAQSKPESFIRYSQSPPPPRLYSYVNDKCLEPLIILFDCCVSSFSSAATSRRSINVLEAYEKATSHLIDCALKEEPATSGFWRHYLRLERVYNATEKASSSAGGGGKKKKKQPQGTTTTTTTTTESANDATEQLKGLVERTATSLRRVEVLLEDMQLISDICCPSRLHLGSSSNDEETAVDEESQRIAAEVRKKTATGLATAEMKALLADKRKVLDSFTF